MTGEAFRNTERTHIRKADAHHETYCGARVGPSISVEHYELVASNYEIWGHVDRLPEPLCAECGRVYDGG